MTNCFKFILFLLQLHCSCVALGTPSDMLPIDLGSCRYDEGIDGSIIHTLASTNIVSALYVGKKQITSYDTPSNNTTNDNNDNNNDNDAETEEKAKEEKSPTIVTWTITNILNHVARKRNPRYNAFIDCGALITGMSNVEVARYLLENGLCTTTTGDSLSDSTSSIEGVVFLNKEDKKMVLLRTGT